MGVCTRFDTFAMTMPGVCFWTTRSFRSVPEPADVVGNTNHCAVLVVATPPSAPNVLDY